MCGEVMRDGMEGGGPRGVTIRGFAWGGSGSGLGGGGLGGRASVEGGEGWRDYRYPWWRGEARIEPRRQEGWNLVPHQVNKA